ncbi:cytochrome c [Terrimonas sp. NA20]|uniref:Cytochrome c n=1 Tax=Terrimonas ginsenosidimutans TaxID=2908004 RepID=A0ABS9KZ33_9BACT|nr:c-type cytochrome [Terrimonas ginsenosidimutans]MCG2617573.1 cytochrome c [Terrimonas ginsenosidimutans]
MRRFKKILKWIGLIVLFLVTGITITVMSRQNMTYTRPYPDITASDDSTIIARGKSLVFGAAHCADCHSLSNADSLFEAGQEVPMGGGFVFDLPFGKIYAANISTDIETGIGKYTDKDIARALRYGVKPDGTIVYPFMPFNNMSDDDLKAIISYLKAQKPVRNKVPDHELNVMGNILKAFLIKPVGPEGTPEKSVQPDSSAAYGQYLASVVANCKGCHTERGPTGDFIGVPFSGASAMEEVGGSFIPPNLTTDPGSRIYTWTEQNFITRFRMGRLQKGSPMPWPSYKRMGDMELKAIYRFLKTLPPSKTKALKPQH